VAHCDDLASHFVWSLAVLIPGWAVGCRRLHDVGSAEWNVYGPAS